MKSEVGVEKTSWGEWKLRILRERSFSGCSTAVSGCWPSWLRSVPLGTHSRERRAALQRDFVAFHAGFAEKPNVFMPRTGLVTAGRRR